MKILFYGGTGQCKVMRPVADLIGKLVAVVDDTENLDPPFQDIEFYCGRDAFTRWRESTVDFGEYGFAITIGNPHGGVRQGLYGKLRDAGLKVLSLIHPNALIEKYVALGTGLQVHAGAIINPGTKVGDCCIVNTRALVEHDCVLENGAEIGPGATLCGNVVVGENAWVGAGAVVRQKLRIGKNAIVGAGAAVVSDVADDSVVVGVPAKPIRRRNRE